jgi:serine protease Do
VNTAVASGAQNIGFAQPVNDLKGLISGVLDNGKLEQPYLGVRYISLTNDLAKEFNLKVSRGAYITSGDNQSAVVDGSPAARAGLKDHDVITKINNITIGDKTSLTAALSRFKVGDQVTLSVNRDGKVLSIKVSLANAPTQ